MSIITVHPNSIIVATKGGLRVYSTRGTVELRSKNLAGVHEMLQGRLGGQYTENALVSAASPTQRVTVRRYLRALREAGAIRSGKNDAAGDFRQRTSEAGDSDRRPVGRQPSLQFITGREFASLLVRSAETRPKARRRIYVLTDESWTSGSGTNVRDREAFYSRWLLGGQFSPLDRPKTEVFEIEKTGALTRKAAFTGRNLRMNREVPKAMDLVRAADIEQAPLAVCHADSILCPIDVRWFGVDYNRVSAVVLRYMLTRMTMETTNAIDSIGWRQLPIEGRVSNPTLPRVRCADDCLIAASLGELRLGLVDRILGQTPGMPVHAEPWDLLQPRSVPDLDYLAQVLRQRHSSLQAQITTRSDGLYECTLGDLRTTSMLKHKALRDMMVLLTWSTYYGLSTAAYRPAHGCDYSFIARPEKLRRIFNCVIAKSKRGIAGRSAAVAKISCWGKNAWIGILHG